MTEATIGRRPKRATTTGPSAADDNLDDILALGHALPVVGDQWSMFIIREAFRHVRRFSDFRVALDLSDAVLAKRLRDLVEAGVFTTVEYTERPPRVEYCLTEQGRDLWSVFVAIWLWQVRWADPSAPRAPQLIHDVCGQNIRPNLACGACGAVGINHLDTRAVRRPGTTFDQSNPRRRYRRSTVRPDSPDGQVFSATLDLLGDRVTVSVLAAATLGMSRFGDMQRELGISPYLLSERLRGFVDNRVMARVPIADGARRQEYRLLPKGLDILPVFVMINEWANRWYPDPEGPALTIVHRACGQPIEPRWSCNACGEYLTMRTIHYTE